MSDLKKFEGGASHKPLSKDRSAHCCLCGEARKPTQAPVPSFSNDCRIVEMNKHREMKPGRWEHATQMLVCVSMYRNGGIAHGETHMCDGCILVGLNYAKDWVNSQIAALSPATEAA